MAGTVFKQDISVLPPGGIISSPLGANATGEFAQADVGKAVKFQDDGNGTFTAVLCAANDDIDGFVSSVEPFTVNSGFSFGGVQVKGRVKVEVGTTAVALGDLVVLESQAALGTAGVPRVVKKPDLTLNSGTVAALATDVATRLNEYAAKSFWKCVQVVTGTGATAGDQIIIERV
jgi:hypothetical protein